MNPKQQTALQNAKNQAYEMYKVLRDIETMTEEKPEIDRLKEAVDAQNYVILDTETTGLHDGEIIEIAIIDHNGETLMDQRIKPYDGIPQESSNVHGIYLKDVENCPHFEDVVVQIKGHLAGKDVIVYNATYDRKMLHRSSEHAGIQRTNWKSFSNWICAMNAFSPIYGEWNDYHQNYKWQKLTIAAAYYNVEVQNAHSALGDCLMTYGVVKKMVESPE